MFTYLFAIAIGMGTAIIIGRLVGGGEKDEATNACEKCMEMVVNFMYGLCRYYIPYTINGTVYR